MIAAFGQLRPDELEVELRERFLKFQHLPKGDPSRKHMEDAIIEDCVPIAKRIAAAIAWRYRKPELAEEIWGEGLVLAVRDHDPRRGYLPGYLKARIRGLARGILWSKMQTGVSTVLRDYGLAVREAEEFLLQELGHAPSEADIAHHLDIPSEKVRTVSQALLASDAVLTDNFEYLLGDAVAPGSAHDLWGNDDVLVSRFRKLSEGERNFCIFTTLTGFRLLRSRKSPGYLRLLCAPTFDGPSHNCIPTMMTRTRIREEAGTDGLRRSATTASAAVASVHVGRAEDHRWMAARTTRNTYRCPGGHHPQRVPPPMARRTRPHPDARFGGRSAARGRCRSDPRVMILMFLCRNLAPLTFFIAPVDAGRLVI